MEEYVQLRRESHVEVNNPKQKQRYARSRDSEAAGVDEEKAATLGYSYVLSIESTESELRLNYRSVTV